MGLLILKPVIERIIQVGLLPREDVMTDVLVALLIGFIFGYGVRELISRRRRTGAGAAGCACR